MATINVSPGYPVKAVATTNTTSLSGPKTIDGQSCVAGDIVLLSGQTDATARGPYLVQTSDWLRIIPLYSGQSWFIEQGTTNVGKTFVLTTAGAITVGSTSLTITAVSSGGGGIPDPGSVGPTQLGTITDGITLDQLGAGNTLEVKALGIGSGQLAANSITSAKIAGGAVIAGKLGAGAVSGPGILGTVTDGITLDQNGTFGALQIKNAGVTAGKLGVITDGITLDQNGAGGTLQVISTTAIVPVLLTANTTITSGQKYIYTDSTGGTFTVTLPAAPADGEIHIIQDVAATAAANNVDIAGNGNQIIYLTTLQLKENLQSWTLQWFAAASQWYIIDFNAGV